jgi:hypothetical protein
MVVHHLAEVLLVLDVLAIDGNNQVPAQHDGDVAQITALTATAQSRAVGGATRYHLHYQESRVAGQPHLVRQLRCDGDGAHAQRGPPHPAQGHQIVQYGLRRIDGNGKSDASTLPHARSNHGVDPNHFTMPVQ